MLDIRWGYNKHSQFKMIKVLHDKLVEKCNVDIVYNDEVLLLNRYVFRSSKAVLIDNHSRLFIKDVEI